MRGSAAIVWKEIQSSFSMRVSAAIAWKEIQSYFTTPMGYIVALVFVAMTGYFFGDSISGSFPKASVDGYTGVIAFILIFLAPAMTMRLMAEEQKLGTVELLLTAPVRDWEVVLGKFLASLTFLIGPLALTLYYVILLYAYGSPDSGPIWSAYLGLILYGALSLSIGLLASSLTNNQMVSLVLGFGALLTLYLLDQASTLVDGVGADILSQMSSIGHLDDFTRGVIDTNNIVYYVTTTAVFLFLTVRSLESRRWR